MKQLIVLVLVCGVALAQNARIAYITPEGQLATVSASGDDMRQLSSGEARHQFPAFSPDGEQIAVLGADAEGGFVHLYRDEDGAEAREIYRDAAQGPFYLYWSPDSARVAFLANNPEGIGLNIASETATELLSTGSPYYWQWREDAKGMLVHANSGEGTRLGFITLKDDTPETDLADYGAFQAPGISADGRFIAYATGRRIQDNRRVIVTSQPADPDLRREVSHEGSAALSWSPLSNQLAIMSPAQDAPAPFGPIQLLDAETGNLEPLTNSRALAFFWSPDGRYIAYLSAADTSNNEFASTTNLQVSATPRNVQGRRLFIDLNLIDVETGEERLLNSFVPSPPFVAQFIPFFDQYALSHRVWSPDSNALIFPVVSDGTSQVAVFDLEGNITLVAEGDMGFWNYR